MRARPIGRRNFLCRGLAASAAVAAPALLRGGAPPSERFRVAHVGIGGRGGTLLRQSISTGDVDVVAVCEVDQTRREEAARHVGSKVAKYGDHRNVLDRKDVDGVIVATPDHWHAIVTIDGCNAGKDIYVEKPLCHYVAEGRAMVDAARRNERMVQVGINHRSAGYIREIVEIVRSGRIGKVSAVKNWMWSNKVAPKSPPTKAPATLDHDRWLGPAPQIPYHPERTHYNFRWCRDYAGGYMTDWGVHMLNVMTFAMDVDHKGPVSVRATGEFDPENLYDFPTSMEAHWRFEDPDFDLHWIQPAEGGDIVAGQKYGMTFYGDAGELRTYFGGHKFYVDGKEEPLPAGGREVDVPRSPGHFRNWLDSIRSRKLPIADVEVGHRTTTICLLGNIALFSGGGELAWDWRKERFPLGEAANRMLTPSYREPYVPVG